MISFLIGSPAPGPKQVAKRHNVVLPKPGDRRHVEPNAWSRAATLPVPRVRIAEMGRLGKRARPWSVTDMPTLRELIGKYATPQPKNSATVYGTTPEVQLLRMV
jgi:hypothetical protein